MIDLRSLIEDDMGIVDGIETVTVTQRDPDTGSITGTANSVVSLKRETTAGAAEIADGGETPKQTTRFHLQANTIAFAPKKRDVIEDGDGALYLITEVRSVVFGTRYVCSVTVFVE